MKSDAEWDGYGSYEAYINRGLGGVFHTEQLKSDDAGGSSEHKKPVIPPVTKRTRNKAQDVYDIVASYPHHKGDKQWLADMLLKLPLAKRRSVMLRYGQVYNSSHSDGADNDSQAGQARRDANTWLLEYVEQ